jgi:acyl transferase domain-containing protein
MAAELYRTSSVFRGAIDRCHALSDGRLQPGLRDVTFDPQSTALLDRTDYAQPALFAIEYSLVELLKSWGITPDAVIGHSLGEYAAAHAAGALALEDGAALVARRGTITQQLAAPGRMAAVLAAPEVVAPALAAAGGTVALAAVNAAEVVAISGPSAALDRVVAALEQQGVATMPLPTTHAFHSPCVEPMLDALEAAARRVSSRPPALAFASTLEGRLLTEAEPLDARYWRRHAREPVRFHDAVRALAADGCTHVVELGPHATLTRLGPRTSPTLRWLPSATKGTDERRVLLDTAAELWLAGVDVDLARAAHDLDAHPLGADAPRPGRSAPRGAAGPGARRGDAIAIVGIACRLPGASTPADYWELLRSGRSAVRRFDADELLAAGVAPDLLADPDFVPVGGSLDDVDAFAAGTFGIAQREALLTAPQQRLLLEVAHELLVATGHERFESEAGIGVFAGTGMHLSSLNTHLLTRLHGTIDRHDPVASLQLLTANEPDFAATRIAYRLGLTGPAVNVQTACSTALTALHVACRALQAGDCDAAIVGTGAIHVPHPNGYVYRKGSIFSPTGACRAFDAHADGTVGGCGVAAILLKPLAAARADGDAVHAVVRGTAINNDGTAKQSFTAPSAAGQRAVVRRALAAAGARADTISFVQAHGTGTWKGDPIEVQGLTDAFRATSSARGACVLGSVKPNVGHLDTCSGLAGLIAAVLALLHGEAPPQANYRTPNPGLRLDDGPFRIVTEPTPLAPLAQPLRAAVTALGVGGTNVHAVLEAAA